LPPKSTSGGGGLTVPRSRVALHVKGFQQGMTPDDVTACLYAAASATGCLDLLRSSEIVVRLVRSCFERFYVGFWVL
jgi:hypothetical protein